MKKLRKSMKSAAAEEIRAQLLDQAKRMAHVTFTRPGRGHVLAVYERLAWNRQHGLGSVGVTTVH